MTSEEGLEETLAAFGERYGIFVESPEEFESFRDWYYGCVFASWNMTPRTLVETHGIDALLREIDASHSGVYS